MFSSRHFVLAVTLIASGFAASLISAGAQNSHGIFEGETTDLITSVPRTMTYQGILKDTADSTVVDSTYDITFRIFNTETGGSSLWEEIIPCSTSAGYFNAIFTNVSLPFDEEYWLELEIGGEILDPRRKINMSAYSARADSSDYAEESNMANNADLLDGSNSDAFADTGHSHIITSEDIQDSTIQFMDIARNNAASNQVIKWNGSAWIASPDETAGPGWSWSDSSSHGPDSVLFADMSVYADNASAADFSDSADAITDGAVDFADIGQNGADTNQIMKWNGSAWIAADDLFGGGTKWTVNDSVLYTTQYWGIARGGSGNVISGDSAHTNINLGISSSVSHSYSVVTGGDENQIAADFSVIGGGESNAISGGSVWTHSIIGGGKHNQIIGSPIRGNNAGYAVITGGHNNRIEGPVSFIGGGESNYIAFDGGYGVISGGQNNGISNGVNYDWGTIGGGRNNHISSQEGYGTISGGYNNTIWDGGTGATIGGGTGNVAGSIPSNAGGSATVSGGSNNTAPDNYSTVSGGSTNSANGEGSTVGGGQGNTAEGTNSIIAGGNSNFAGGNYSTISGGYADTIEIGADYSYLFGINSNLSEDSTFMIDMPHIHFGDEATGYEIPTEDGAAGQVMATDGSGQLSWIGSPSGPNWTVGDSVLYTNSYWGIARGGAGNVISGDSSHTNVNLGVASSIALPTDYFVIQYSSIGGGHGNNITAPFASIVGGDSNQIHPADFIASYGFIGGGKSNIIGGLGFGSYASIVGGLNNTNGGDYSFIGGGENNFMTRDGGHSVIGGGKDNYIGGGAVSMFGTIGGGINNQINSDGYSTIGGGWNNNIRGAGEAATISGGYSNTAANNFPGDGGYGSTVGGGVENLAAHNYSTVAGGNNNSANWIGNTIGGGENNSTEGWNSVISGGKNNFVAGDYSAILGGIADTIYANADYSYLYGINSHLTQDSTFMVDMPHIHFGDDSTGYEFPSVDGADGQVMATDGSGQLSWVDINDMVQAEMQEMRNTIDDLRRQNEELADRIQELESKTR